MENTIHVLGIVSIGVMLALAAAMWLRERGAFDAVARMRNDAISPQMI